VVSRNHHFCYRKREEQGLLGAAFMSEKAKKETGILLQF